MANQGHLLAERKEGAHENEIHLPGQIAQSNGAICICMALRHVDRQISQGEWENVFCGN